MEGLAGQADPRTWSFANPVQYEYGRTLLMADLNAVIDGLFAGGADSVFVVAWGRQRVPLIFVSGDDQLKQEISESLPWIEYVVTKRSRNQNVVELLPVDAVRAELRDRARIAAANWTRMHAVTISELVHVQVETFEPVSLEPLRDVPGVTFEGDRVTFVAPDFRSATMSVFALMRVAIQFAQAPNVWRPGPGERGYHGAM